MRQTSQEGGAMMISDQEVPDLSGVTGYTMDDFVYNQAGMQSPAQQRQGYKRIVAAFASGAFGVAFALFCLFHGIVPFAVALLVILGFAALKTMREFEDVSAGAVSHVDGDIRTELVRDSESPDTYLLRIAGMKLAITRDAYDVLLAGGPYRSITSGTRGWRRSAARLAACAAAREKDEDELVASLQLRRNPSSRGNEYREMSTE